MKNYDVIIIGGGPAGASAALYIARGGLSVCVVHSGVSALHKAELIQNYYGTGDVSGAALYEAGLCQVRGVGAEVLKAEVTFVAAKDAGFDVSTTAGELHGKKLVLATGAARRTADIKGLKECEGMGVSYCAVCDAFFCRGKTVGLLGAGRYAMHEYDTLKAAASDVYVFTNGEAPCFDVPQDRLITGEVKEVLRGQNGRVRGVTAGGNTVELAMLFVALGVMNSSAIAKSVGVVTDDNSAIAVTDGMTNIPGLYAAGDCTAGIKQVSRAVADGMAVGLRVVNDVRAEVRR